MCVRQNMLTTSESGTLTLVKVVDDASSGAVDDGGIKTTSTQLSTTSTPDHVRKRIEKLTNCRSAIRQSQLLKQTNNNIHFPVETLRCLALGSPMDSMAALYQLAYILELQLSLNCHVSVYDPIFSNDDETLFCHYNIRTAKDEELQPGTTLYFLPHADLSVTSDLFAREKPLYLLGNNLISHTNSFTKLELHSKYPLLSHLVHLIEPPATKEVESEFVVAKLKKRRNKYKYVPPVLQYDFSDKYFSQVRMVQLGELGPWMNAFTDLALHIIDVDDVEEKHIIVQTDEEKTGGSK